MKKKEIDEDVLSEKDSTLLVVARACILGLMLLVVSYYSYNHPELSTDQLFLPIALLFGITAVSGLWLNSIKPGRYFTQIELVIYSCMVTLIVYITGLAASPLLFLYLPLVMLAGALTTHKNTIFLTAVSITLYYTAIQNEIYSWMGFPKLIESVIEPAQGLKLQILGLLSGMILIGISTRFLKSRLELQSQLTKKITLKLKNLELEEEALLNSLTQGVIVFNQKHKLIKINDSSFKLLNIDKSEGISSKFLFELMPGLEEKIYLKQESEFSINLKSKNKECSLNCKLSIVKSMDQEEKEFLLLINDTTKLQTVENELQLQNKMARLLAEKDKKIVDNYNIDDDFVGNSEKMKTVFSSIAKVASSNANVLVFGESGTGKELVAKAMHKISHTDNKPFIAVNCGAIPENLIESHLFGHKKGSFTGASSDHKGFFQQANYGTIFLDEIGELPIHLQAKLLRAIQERKIRPIGSEIEYDINVRIISATNRNLKEEVEKNNFREDLYYRLNVINIPLPSLRERKEDIPLLVDSIMKKFSTSETLPIIPPETLKLLMKYDYPGNIRELENILERAVVFGGEIVLPENLPSSVLGYENQESQSISSTETQIITEDNMSFDDTFDLDTHLKEIERKYLEAALLKADGVKTKAAKQLGMNFRSFRYRLEKFDISE